MCRQIKQEDRKRKGEEMKPEETDRTPPMPEFPLLSTQLTTHEINQEVGKKKYVSCAKALVDFIAAAQTKHSTPLNAYPLQRRLPTKQSPAISDPATYLEHVLSRASGPTLTDAFEAPHQYHHECIHCNTIKNYEDHEFNSHDRKPYKAPTHETEPAWLTNITPTFSQHELHYDKAASRDLNTLLYKKHRNPEYVPCKSCKVRNPSNLKKTWEGYSYAPDNLSFAFDHSVEQEYKLTLPLEHDFNTFMHGHRGEIKYRLVTVVKKLRTGMFAAFVHAVDGKC